MDYPDVFVWLDVAGVLSSRLANLQCCTYFFRRTGLAKSYTQRCNSQRFMAVFLRHDRVRLRSQTRARRVPRRSWTRFTKGERLPKQHPQAPHCRRGRLPSRTLQEGAILPTSGWLAIVSEVHRARARHVQRRRMERREGGRMEEEMRMWCVVWSVMCSFVTRREGKGDGEQEREREGESGGVERRSEWRGGGWLWWWWWAVVVELVGGWVDTRLCACFAWCHLSCLCLDDTCFCRGWGRCARATWCTAQRRLRISLPNPKGLWRVRVHRHDSAASPLGACT